VQYVHEGIAACLASSPYLDIGHHVCHTVSWVLGAAVLGAAAGIEDPCTVYWTVSLL